MLAQVVEFADGAQRQEELQVAGLTRTHLWSLATSPKLRARMAGIGGGGVIGLFVHSQHIHA